MSLNRVIISGNCCADAEVRCKGENVVATVRVAATTSRKGADGKLVTEYYSITCFGKQAEFAEKWAKKGKPIVVEGSFRNDNYTDKNGNKVYGYQIVASNITFGNGAATTEINLTGNLTKDPEVRVTAGDKNVTVGRFTVACDRGKDSQGNSLVDYVDVVCFGKLAENLEKYRSKGDAVLVRGEIINEKWTDKDGNERYSVRIYADKIAYGKKKGEDTASSESSGNDFMTIPDDAMEELPFT